MELENSQGTSYLLKLCRVIDYAELFGRFFQKPKESPFFIFAARHNSGGLLRERYLTNDRTFGQIH